MASVERGGQVEFLALLIARQQFVAEVLDQLRGVLLLGVDVSALINRRQEGGKEHLAPGNPDAEGGDDVG